MVSLFTQEGVSPTMSVSTKTRRDFSRELYDACAKDDDSSRKSFSSKHSTWFSILRSTIRHSAGHTHTTRHAAAGDVGKEDWVDALSSAMLSNGIECVPGMYQSRISCTKIVRLVGQAPSSQAMKARPGSLKRAAIEAECRAELWAKRRKMTIDFGCKIPFTNIPKMIDEGFRLMEKNFKRGDARVLRHYEVARHSLVGCLGDPLCDLMLMIALTLASSSETPWVAPKSNHFEVGPKKDARLLAANLVTRMLWFLRPQDFPWDKDDGQVLRVSEMTKKVEQKGVNNRVLRELGWVVVVRGTRDSPRNSDVELQKMEELLWMRKELLGLRKDATRFIRRVFHSHDNIWVERCKGIISEE